MTSTTFSDMVPQLTLSISPRRTWAGPKTFVSVMRRQSLSPRVLLPEVTELATAASGFLGPFPVTLLFRGMTNQWWQIQMGMLVLCEGALRGLCGQTEGRKTVVGLEVKRWEDTHKWRTSKAYTPGPGRL